MKIRPHLGIRLEVGDLAKFSTAGYEVFSEEERKNYFEPKALGVVVELHPLQGPDDQGCFPTIKIFWPSECKTEWHHWNDLEMIWR